ncbi:MAG TPA: PAS domain-containing sensor histidine kinase [Myxococcales bacterium]|nr:PAS domain-containing sensor histidine kinase [Myxococcales bacterium]
MSASSPSAVDLHPEALLAAIGELVPAVFAYIDREERLLYANRSYAERHGRAAASMVGCLAREALGPAWERVAPYVRRALAGESVSFETSVARHDGSHLWISATYVPHRGPDGKVHGMVALAEEGGGHRAAEERLRQSEGDLRQLADVIPQIVWVARASGEVEFHNRRWYEYTGFAPGDAKGSWTAVVHPDDLPAALEAVRRAMVDHSDFALEYRLRRHDGAYRWHLARSVFARDANGRPARRFSTATDIHDQKLAEERLTQALRQRDVFASVASHELRTPLTALALRLQRRRLLARRGEAVDVQQLLADTEVEERQVQRLARLVEQMLDATRLVNGRLPLDREPMELGELVREVAGSMGEALRQAGCPVSISGPPVSGEWDRGRLEQVVVNLLANAMRYGARAPIAVEISQRPGLALLSVRDGGVGIGRGDQERIFHRFERAASEQYPGGMGLGLYISREIARAHGGDIRVESETGKGAVFTVELPR